MPNPPPKPQKLRVLRPETAKARGSHDPSSAAATPSSHNTAIDPELSTHKRAPRLASFFSSLRSRYAALPIPVRRSITVLRYVAPLVPIAAFFSDHVLQVLWVRGASMAPYLNEGYGQTHTNSDMVLVSMWPWSGFPAPFSWTPPSERRRKLERGMVVTFRSPANPAHIAVKRIVALPGDRIFTRSPYAKDSQIVPFNHVWLEGDADDPRKSLDSNTYGPVSMNLVTGRVLAVLRPRFRWLNWKDWEEGVFDSGDSDRGPVVEYRKGVRDRVIKGAVNLERPSFG